MDFGKVLLNGRYNKKPECTKVILLSDIIFVKSKTQIGFYYSKKILPWNLVGMDEDYLLRL